MTRNLGINGWLEIARNLSAGRGYSEHSLLTYFPVDKLIPTAARSPIPVFILSSFLLFFNRPTLVLFMYSWMLSAATAVLLFLLAKRVFKSNRWGFGAAFLYCFYLPEMNISSAYASASEGVFTLFLMGYFFTALTGYETNSRLWISSAALLLALAGLSRPIVAFFPLLYGVLMIGRYRKKALLSMGCFCVVFLICLSPWAIRNQIVFGKPVLTSTLGGYNLLRHNFGIQSEDYRLKTAEDFAPFAQSVITAAGYDFKSITEVQADKVFTREAFRIIRKYPYRYLKLSVRRMLWLWYKIGAETPLYWLQNAVIYLWMFPGMILVVSQRHVLSFFVPHILYFVFFCAAINAQFRFICPLMPYGILLALYAVRMARAKVVADGAQC